MKIVLSILIFVTAFLGACSDKVDPAVDTLYLKDGDRQSQRLEAIPKLYQHYINSEKDKIAYEVISKEDGHFILNYDPIGKLLTLCGDPGSGWSRQFKEVDETTLQKLVTDGLSFDEIESIGTIGSKFDSLLVLNKPMSSVKTNGDPQQYKLQNST